MSLTDIRDYLRQEQSASLKQIANHFKADSSLVESMLDHWILKGRVAAKQHDAFGSACCGKCGGMRHKRYEWIN
ncbi:conserved hypothetical protein [Chlorobaculum parvum NCIB 8327]|uniref:Transcriptional regulator HTH-type FeoC domain-containing protein n=1 Tax=Chlorobaculum parvum (strain DSM 263 / NCIMB 8327) TaxID=517417 RepID=B3QPH9_CHLP8|nr:FeoC-like transcriptional regulator [Chlorobaculum parvum]ACF11832.1 conserved hypothetical protein [Chlorobaculum parvum NCIB 8327]